MNVLGTVLGYLLPQLFVDDYQESMKLTHKQEEQYKSQLFTMFLAVAIACVVIFVLTLLTFREKPEIKICGSKTEAEEET